MGNPAQGAGVVREKPKDPTSWGRRAAQEYLYCYPCVDEYREEFKHIDVEEAGRVRRIPHRFCREDWKPHRLEVGGREAPFETKFDAESPQTLVGCVG